MFPVRANPVDSNPKCGWPGRKTRLLLVSALLGTSFLKMTLRYIYLLRDKVPSERSKLSSSSTPITRILQPREAIMYLKCAALGRH